MEPGDGYVASVMPGVALFGLGPTLFGAPLTGITSEELFDPAQMTDGFHIAMAACAALATIGGVPAWHKISRDALEPEPARLGRERRPLPASFSCDVAGLPLRPAAGRPAALGR